MDSILLILVVSMAFYHGANDLKCDHGAPDHIKHFDAKRLGVRRIVTGLHCYGCTAGAGSSGPGTVV